MSTRRFFLGQATVSLAAISTMSAKIALGSQANSRLRVGMIGCGQRGTMVARLFRENGYCEIAGAADYFRDHAHAVAVEHQLGDDRIFSGLQCGEKMIAAGGLDAVAIISPPYFHPAQARAAVDAGLNVYLAKPVAVDVPGCMSVKETAARAAAEGLCFLVDFQTRTNEFFIEAMRRVHAGTLGVIGHGEALYHAGRLQPKTQDKSPEGRLLNWVFDQKLSGDIIVEQNIHTLDVMNWVMNHVPPVRVSGMAGRKVRVDVGDNNDAYSLVYEYPQDVGMTFSSRQFDVPGGAPGGIINRVFGSTGSLHTEYGGEVMIRSGEANFYRGGKSAGIYKDGIVANIASFQKAVAGRDKSNPTVEPSVLSNLIAIFGRMAAAKRQPVSWQELMASKEELKPDLGGLSA
jgi:predicted dehydrogenase